MKNVVISSFIILSSVCSIGLKSPIIANAGTLNITESSDVVEDLKLSSNFNLDNFKLDSTVSDDESISGITLTEVNNNLYFYVFNENGKPLGRTGCKTRITMSVTGFDKDYNHYFINLLDKSDDNLFYKYKIDNFNVSTSPNREYHISEIEYDLGDGFANGRHATIGKSFYYSGVNENKNLYVKDLEVVTLNVTPNNYRFNILNENSTADEEHYWDMHYITFPIKRNYGDVVGIKLTWSEAFKHQEKRNGEILFDHSYSKFSDPKVMTYTNKDLLNILSLNTAGKDWNKFLVNLNPFHLFQNQSLDYKDIPVIEKITFDKTDNSSFKNLYLNDETKKMLNDSYFENLGAGNDIYVIRFSTTDFVNKDWMTRPDSLGIMSSMNKTEKTLIVDCDVIELTFCKDGNVYNLPVSSKPVDHDPGDIVPEPAKPEWFNTIIKVFNIILTVLLVLLVVKILSVVPIHKWLANAIVWIVSLPIKGIKKLIQFFKKKEK